MDFKDIMCPECGSKLQHCDGRYHWYSGKNFDGAKKFRLSTNDKNIEVILYGNNEYELSAWLESYGMKVEEVSSVSYIGGE
jgi:hypothetical protein